VLHALPLRAPHAAVSSGACQGTLVITLRLSEIGPSVRRAHLGPQRVRHSGKHTLRRLHICCSDTQFAKHELSCLRITRLRGYSTRRVETTENESGRLGSPWAARSASDVVHVRCRGVLQGGSYRYLQRLPAGYRPSGTYRGRNHQAGGTPRATMACGSGRPWRLSSRYVADGSLHLLTLARRESFGRCLIRITAPLVPVKRFFDEKISRSSIRS
jgi:hypothetical protein